jgi:mRNA interferase RelE/StbE
MTYELAFDRRALKEWQKLGHTIREQFKKKLAERLENPRVPAARLHGHADRYKIKLRASGYRLVYQVIDEKVIDEKVVLLVIAVGRRESSEVYQIADLR